MYKIGFNNSSKHYGDLNHYEKPDRTHYCIDNLKSILKSEFFLTVFEEQSDYQKEKEFALDIIKQTHSENYLSQIQNFRTTFIICRNCNKQILRKTKKTFEDFITEYPNCPNCDGKITFDNTYCFASIDTYFTPYTFNIALEGVMVLLKLQREMKKNNLASSFAIIRPPGHHCNNDPNGFCVFNNVFIAANNAQKLGWNKVLILDVDFHHGDGTQQLLEKSDDPDISFVSIHGYGKNIYPGTGKNSNLDTNILNIPVAIEQNKKSREYVTDEYYQNILLEKLAFPFIREQNPDFVIVSLGFDAHQDDPLEGLNITDETYIFLTNWLKNFNKPVLFVLEGGYNINTINRLITQMVSVFS